MFYILHFHFHFLLQLYICTALAAFDQRFFCFYISRFRRNVAYRHVPGKMSDHVEGVLARKVVSLGLGLAARSVAAAISIQKLAAD